MIRFNRAPERSQIGLLQVVLWVVWTLAVVCTAVAQSWHALAAKHPLNTIGLLVHCTVVGTVGLVIMTVVEQRFEPWRFL